METGEWSQCATVWHRQRVVDFLEGRPEEPEYFWEQVYQLGHLVTVFWGPFVVICVAYGCIVARLLEYSIRPYSAVPRTVNEETVVGDENAMELLKPPGHRTRCSIDEEQRTELMDAPTFPAGNHRRKTSFSPGQVPTWRLQMRSRMFRTTVYVLLAYAFFWLPYNAIALAMFVDSQIHMIVSEHLAVLRCFTLFNAVLNPFIYGLSSA